MKKAILFILTIFMCFCLPLQSYSIELTPYVDGTYWDQPCSCGGASRGCAEFFLQYCPCMPDWCYSISANSLSAHYYCDLCGTYQEVLTVQVKDRNIGLLEFDISSARGLFEQNNIRATLQLTVNTVNHGTGSLFLYDSHDQYEDGVLHMWDYSAPQIASVDYTSLQPGDVVTFDVTDAVKHDLFDAGQTDYSSFSLGTPLNGIDSTFYNHTATAYSPKLIIEAATVVTISSFNAKPKSNKIVLYWITASEINNAGFNLYRSTSENGGYTKINDSLTPAQGSSTQGASYEFVDKDVKNRKTYYYKLEDIDLSGNPTLHGPVSATPRLIYGIRNR